MASEKKAKAEEAAVVYTLTGARELKVGEKTYKRGQEVPASDVVGFEQYCTIKEK